MAKDRKWITILDATVAEGADRFPGDTLEVSQGTYKVLVEQLGKAQPASADEIEAARTEQLEEARTLAMRSSEAAESSDEAGEFLELLTTAQRRALESEDITTPEEIIELGLEGLVEIKGIGEASATKILETAVEWNLEEDEEDDEEEGDEE